MPHVVTEKCVKCKYTDCLSVCPVVCFHEAPEFVVIDPDECIDCGMCVDACPAAAIYAADAVPARLAQAVDLNARLARVLPLVLDPGEPLPGADEWNGVENKWRFVDERGLR